MSHIYTSADQLIGRTPLLELTHIEKKLRYSTGGGICQQKIRRLRLTHHRRCPA